MSIGLEDGVIVAGLVLVALALWLAAGWAGLLGFVGGLLAIVGLVWAWRNGQA